MKKLLAVALATMMTQQAVAENWYLLGKSTSGGKYYIDPDSIQTDYLADGTPVMTAWSQTEYKQAQDAGGGKEYWTSEDFYYFDCRAHKFDIEYIATYDKQGGVVTSGDMPSFSRYSSANWQRVVPGSTSETLLNTVCLFAN